MLPSMDRVVIEHFTLEHVKYIICKQALANSYTKILLDKFPFKAFLFGKQMVRHPLIYPIGCYPR